MASYTPHKQTILITIMCIVVVGGTYIYTKGGFGALMSPQNPTTNSIVTINTVENAAPLSTSSDWRKSFFTGTSSTPTKLIATQSTAQENLSLTDSFGRDFFARYIQLKQSGLRDNQLFVADTLDTSIGKAADAAKKARVYTLSDITIQTTANPANLRIYGNAVGNIFSTYGVDGDPATVANDAFEKGDMTLLKNIDPMITAYGTITTMLKNTPVPQPLATYHLTLLNAVSGMTQIARDLRNVEGDPMQTMVSIGLYPSVQTSLIGALRSMKTYFGIVPIVFTATEAGSLFSLEI